MIRGFVFLLVVGMFFSVSGCAMDEVLGAKENRLGRYEPKLNLSAKENQSLKSWSDAAALADEVGDCTTAILYYTKIVDYFPDTKEGKKAQNRLDEISGNPDVDVEEEKDSLHKRR